MADGIDIPGGARTPGRGAVYRSAATAVALAWSLRLIGLVSVFILARLLSPSDFGIVGLAAAFIALIEIFTAVGLYQALLRIDRPEREHYDTAWTIQVILFGLLALALAALAPFAARFYGEPALGPVIGVLALRFVFFGLVNIGVVDFDRNLDFGRDLRMRVGTRLSSFAATVALALWLHSYWALVIGLLLQSAFLAIASYLAHPFRPRLSLSRRSELLGVSIWIFLASSAQVVHHQVERLVVGRFAAIHLVGLYSVSKDLAAIFTQEIATALNRVTFVTTARGGRPLRDDPGRLGTMLGAYAMIAAPMGLGLAATAEDTVAVLLGDQWRAAAPLLQLIGPAAALFAVYKLIVSSLQASGLVRGAATLSGAGALLATGTMVAAALAGGDAVAIAATALAVNLAVLAGGTFAIARVAQAGFGGLVGAIVRPFAAAAVMAALVAAVAPDTGSAVADLALEVAGGAAVYAAALFLLWIASGRPRGAEAEAFSLAGESLRRLPVQRGASRRT